MTPNLWLTVLQTAAALAVPAGAAFLLMNLSKLYTRVNALPDWEKRVLVTIYGVCMTGIGHALGIKLPEVFGALSGTDVQAILSTGIAFPLHRAFKTTGA